MTSDSATTNPDPKRFFSPTSPWNQPASGTVDPKSATMISSGQVGSLKWAMTQTGRGFDIAGCDEYADYGVPYVTADASAPKFTVKDKYGWWGGPFTNIAIPTNATPAVGTDHHRAVLNTVDNHLYEFWEMTKNADGTWSAGFAAKFDATGTGFQVGYRKGSARAYGGSLIAGAIRHYEIEQGAIHHALGLAYPGSAGISWAAGLGTDGVTMNIASHSDEYQGAERNGPANIPEGARLRLKASVDIDARCQGRSACKIIATALKTYGAYVVDNSAVPTFYVETNSPWANTVRTNEVSAFTADDYELLSLPAQLATLTP